jgi:energy-coupling factor transporter ATP-binding protein EcfA2
MLDLKKIDLGKDEAENDERLKEYFLKTESYHKALAGEKTIIIGRKGSGKSAIFKLLDDELSQKGDIIIKITPDQYSWSILKDYKEQGILPEQAHTNAWKLTLLSSIVWKLNDLGKISEQSKLKNYYNYMKDSFTPKEDNWFFNLVNKVKSLLKGVKTQWLSFEDTPSIATPLKIIEEIKYLLIKESKNFNENIRIIIDRLDDSWDSSNESKNMIIGLLKASNEINSLLNGKIKVITFLRSDIYDNLFFDDQDKLRQNEEILVWDTDSLKRIITERVRVSLELQKTDEDIWKELFSEKLYRSNAKAEKYIIDRTFKRPRDMLSFVRFCIENAIKHNHQQIESDDTRIAEEEKYSQSKYKDLIIEYQKQLPFIKELLDSFSGCSHKFSQEELCQHIAKFYKSNNSSGNPKIMINNLFVMGVIGIKKRGRAGIKQRGGIGFYYYYDDPSTRPLSYTEFYIHPALRYFLNIKEHRGN